MGTIVGIGTLIAQKLRKTSKQNHEQNAITQGFATETLNNMKTVRSFSAEDYHIDKYNQLNERSSQSGTLIITFIRFLSS